MLDNEKRGFPMPENIKLTQQNLLDLDMVQCGSQTCEPNHSFGPAVRDHFLVHFILEGTGVFITEKEEYHLKEGDGFLICPNIVTKYTADSKTPWHYVWIGFKGTKATHWLRDAGLSYYEPIFSDKNHYIRDCFLNMLKAGNMNDGRELRLLGLLYLFLSELAEKTTKTPAVIDISTRKEIYIRKAIEYFTMNFSRTVSISGLASHLGLDRSYFSALFHDAVGESPKGFLIHLRMDKACQFMQNPNLSIGDIARSVGYEDPLLFSKIFRKHKGLAPNHYRKSIK